MGQNGTPGHNGTGAQWDRGKTGQVKIERLKTMGLRQNAAWGEMGQGTHFTPFLPSLSVTGKSIDGDVPTLEGVCIVDTSRRKTDFTISFNYRVGIETVRKRKTT